MYSVTEIQRHVSFSSMDELSTKIHVTEIQRHVSVSSMDELSTEIHVTEIQRHVSVSNMDELSTIFIIASHMLICDPHTSCVCCAWLPASHSVVIHLQNSCNHRNTAWLFKWVKWLSTNLSSIRFTRIPAVAMALRRSQPPCVTEDAIANILLDNIPTDITQALKEDSSKGQIVKIKFEAGGRPDEDCLSIFACESNKHILKFTICANIYWRGLHWTRGFGLDSDAQIECKQHLAQRYYRDAKTHRSRCVYQHFIYQHYLFYIFVKLDN